MVRSCLVASLSILLLAAPAFAAGDEVLPAQTIATSVAIGPQLPTAAIARGPVLPALYGTLAGLQAYDGWSTVRAVRLGATEANPAVAGLANNARAMWAVKAGATMVSIYAAERLWRRNRRTEAIVTMIAVNSAMAMVAVHNASVLRGLK
jgi:hypothetical protein